MSGVGSPGGGSDLRREASRRVLGAVREDEDTASGFNVSQDSVPLHRTIPSSSARSFKSLSKSATSKSPSQVCSRIQNTQLDYDLKVRFHELKQEEKALHSAMKKIDIEMSSIEEKIKDYQESMEDQSNDEEKKELKRKVTQLQNQLREKRVERRMLTVDTETALESIEEQRKLLLEEADLEKEKIAESFEQALDSDEEALVDNTVVNNKDERVQLFVNQTASENERLQKEKADAEEKALALEHQQRRSALEAQLVKQKSIAEQSMQKAKEEARRIQDEAKRIQEEADKKVAESMQEQFKIEEELKSLGLSKAGSTHSFCHSAPSAAPIVNYDERLINMFAEAITRSATPSQPSNTPTENNKFLARYSDKGLPNFNGKPEDWPYFFACFETSTKEGGLSNATNMGRLGKALQGEARDHVKDMMLSPANVPDIIKALKRRFGQPKHIIQAMRAKIENVPPVLIDKASTLIEFGAAVRNFTAIVKTLECPEYMANPDLLDALEKKLPDLTKINWLSWIKTSAGVRNLVHFAKWVEEQADFACEICPPLLKSEEKTSTAIRKVPFQQEKKGVSVFEKLKHADVPTAAGLFAGEKRKCIFCGKHPYSEECWKARNMSLNEKQKMAKDQKCCLNCLKPGHWAKDCQLYSKCIVCDKKHVALMCPENQGNNSRSESSRSSQKPHTSPPPPSTQQPRQPEQPPTTSETGHVSNANLACSSNTFLPTLMVKVFDKKGGYHSIRVLIDSGSERSYVLRSRVEELGLSPEGEEDIIHSLFGGVHTQVKKYKRYEVHVIGNNGDTSLTFKVLDAERICGSITRVAKGPWMTELRRKGVWLTDCGPNPSPVELLIGSDGIRELYTGRIVELSNGLTAVETALGWTVQGKLQTSSSYSAMVVQGLTVQTLTAMEVPLNQFWDLEAIGIRDPSEQKSKQEKEELAKEHFMNTVTRSEDGRYVVSLPWIDGKPNIPSNKKIAEKRLESTTRSLVAKGQYQNYDKLFKEWEKESFIEEVSQEEEEESPSHYIPHRAVFKPESLTTPIRPVFDASCKAPRTPSLNECMEKGPNLLELIPSILLRFREKKIGVISDIRKAFQMIDIAKEDQDFLRFLWWEDDSQKKLKIYKHRRVVFGVNSSPFLLAAVLEHHLTNVDPNDRRIANRLLKSLYVDNCVTSEDTMDEVMDFKKWSTECLAEAKMDLRSWECGFVEESGIGLLPYNECGLDSGRRTSHEEKQITSVLGYKWNKVEDTLYCDVNFENIPEKISKRTILSYLQKVYDPIGFTCPATLPPKLLLQKLWLEKVSWDDELGQEHREDFLTWCLQVKEIPRIQIPRNMRGRSSSRESWQLHTFSDGSQKAYSAVVFLRSEDDDGTVTVQLLQAKARVAPLKKITINRLELMGCFIAAILATSIIEALDLQGIPTQYWSDSTTALSWIKDNDEWGTFVGNRVKTICSLTKTEDWRHVPGVLNPADLPSRGCSPSQLLKERWYEGPAWLKTQPEDWPNAEEIRIEEEILAEKKKSSVQTLLVTPEGVLENPWYARSSTYLKNLKTMAWIIKFINSKIRKLVPMELISKIITPQEYDIAERVILRLLQKDTIPQDQANIAGLPVCRLEQDDGLIHVKTKLSNREDTQGFKFPIILPHAHPIVDQIIRWEHFRNRHAGAQFLMGHLREKVWIIQGRKAIRRVLAKCIQCRRFTARKNKMTPPALPEDRVKSSKAFEITRVDLAGPLFTTTQNKSWIVLFTCAVYRCVHLELVPSLSTEAFLDAFTRFMSRRGRPVTMYSDNGTNFVGADNALKDLDWEKIQREHGIERIRWKFNPPASPWWGGWWERLVRSIKDLLRRSLKGSKINFEKLRTVLCEIESVINNRPLTFVTEDPEDFRPLTPAMFLHELPFPGIADQNLLDPSGFQKLHHNQITVLMRFRTEYFALLVHRGKAIKNSRELQVGEIVLLGADNVKRWEWPMGRIVKTIPGKDGHVRVVYVKTAGGVFIRPIQHIYPMEISSPQDVPGLDDNGDHDEVAETLEDGQEQIEIEALAEQDEAGITTRFGRKVKVPQRLGQ